MGASCVCGVYPQLLRTWATEFDWGWADGYPSLSIIQQSWVFLLYVMQCLPDDELPATLIGDSFAQAFPMALEEMAESERFGEQDDHGVRDSLVRAVQLRAVECFAIFFGLLDSRLERAFDGFNHGALFTTNIGACSSA